MIELPTLAEANEFTERCRLYAMRKLDWLEEHPDAEADEVEDAMRRIALEQGL